MSRATRAAVAAFVFGLLGLPAAVRADALVMGTVRTVLRPLGGVHILAPASGQYAISDSMGRFTLAGVAAGSHALRLVAIGYAPLERSILVEPAAAAAGRTVDLGALLLSPLRPEGSVGHMPPPVAGSADSARAPLLPTPRVVGLYRTDDEVARWPADATPIAAAAMPASASEAFGSMLRRIAVADSITTAPGGMGAPGFETWRQWADRLTLFASDSTRRVNPHLAADSSLVVRAIAYTRARAALAAGRTHEGYALAAQARVALSRARRAGEGAGAAFLDDLAAELDREFAPGSAPPAKPVPVKKARRSRRR